MMCPSAIWSSSRIGMSSKGTHASGMKEAIIQVRDFGVSFAGWPNASILARYLTFSLPVGRLMTEQGVDCRLAADLQVVDGSIEVLGCSIVALPK